MNNNHIAWSYDLQKLKEHLQHISKNVQKEFKDSIYCNLRRDMLLVLGFSLMATVSLGVIFNWLATINYPMIVKILLFIFAFISIIGFVAIFFANFNYLLSTNFMKKKFLNKKKDYLIRMLGYYNLNLDDVIIDYKNLEIKLKPQNK